MIPKPGTVLLHKAAAQRSSMGDWKAASSTPTKKHPAPSRMKSVLKGQRVFSTCQSAHRRASRHPLAQDKGQTTVHAHTTCIVSKDSRSDPLGVPHVGLDNPLGCLCCPRRLAEHVLGNEQNKRAGRNQVPHEAI